MKLLILILCVTSSWMLASCTSNISSYSGGKQIKSIDPVGAYSGRAVVSSILDLPKGQQEIGVELPDGRITSIKTIDLIPVVLGQKVKISRKKNGTGTLSL